MEFIRKSQLIFFSYLGVFSKVNFEELLAEKTRGEDSYNIKRKFLEYLENTKG